MEWPQAPRRHRPHNRFWDALAASWCRSFSECPCYSQASQRCQPAKTDGSPLAFLGLGIVCMVLWWLGRQADEGWKVQKQEWLDARQAIEFHGQVIADRSVQRFHLGGSSSALLTDSEILVDKAGSLTRIRLDNVAAISVDDGHLAAQWLRIDYPGGPLSIETYGTGRQLHELRDAAMARIDQTRRPHIPPPSMIHVADAPRSADRQVLTLGIPPSITMSDIDRARDVLIADAKTMATAMLKYGDHEQAETDLGEMSDRLPIEDAVAALEAFKIARALPAEGLTPLLAVAVPRAVTRLQQEYPNDWVRYLRQASDSGDTPFMSTTTGYNGRVVAMALASLAALLKHTPQ